MVKKEGEAHHDPRMIASRCQDPDFKADLTDRAVSIRDEAWLGNARFITAVTLLRHPRAISSGL
jgi:hypothetical protein